MLPAEISDLLEGFNPFRKKEGKETREQKTPFPSNAVREAKPIKQPIFINETKSEFLTELQHKPTFAELELEYIGFTTWHDELRLIRPINNEGILFKIMEALNTLC